MHTRMQRVCSKRVFRSPLGHKPSTPAVSDVPVVKRLRPPIPRAHAGPACVRGVVRVTAPVVPPIIPSPPSITAPATWAPGLGPGGARWRSPLPLVELSELASGPGARLVGGTATMDCNGRLAEATVIAALGWAVGTRLDIDVRARMVVVSAAPDAAFTITQLGQIRLPAPVRHRCQLAAGDRLLLAADPDAGRLLVYPPRVWQTMIIEFLAGRLDDGPGAS
jgi:hypothetical protein